MISTPVQDTGGEKRLKRPYSLFMEAPQAPIMGTGIILQPIAPRND